MHFAQSRFTFPCSQEPKHVTQFLFNFPCGQPLQVLQFCFNLPWGQALQSPQMYFNFPCSHCVHWVQLRFNFPCGHARHSLQFSMTIPWGHRRRDLGALTPMSVLLWLVVEVDTLVLDTKSVSPLLAVVFELCKLTPSYPPFSSCLIPFCVHWSRATLGNSLLANDTADPTALFSNCHCLPPRAEEISASALCSYCKIKACMCNKAGKELSKLWSSKIKHCKITALNLV